MDQRSSRDGSAIEELGYYDPNSKDETINLERVEYWQSCGALASETVDAIIKRAKGGIKLADKVRVSKPSRKAVAKAKAAVAAEAKAAADAKAAAEAKVAAEAKAAADAKAAAEAEAKAAAEAKVAAEAEVAAPAPESENNA